MIETAFEWFMVILLSGLGICALLPLINVIISMIQEQIYWLREKNDD